MAYPVQVDQTEQGLNRLPFVLQDKENWTKLVQLFLNKLNEIEEVLQEILQQRDIYTVEGQQLDFVGKILGETRDTRSDDDYRSALLFNIGKRSSNGTPDNVSNLIKQYTSSQKVTLCESGMAFATISFDGKDHNDASLYELVEDIRPIAIRVILHSDYYDNALMLAYEDITADAESFSVYPDGTISDAFNVTLDGINYEAFFSVSTEESYYEDSIAEGRNSFYYESPEDFQVTLDGTTFEDFVVNSEFSTYPEFKVVTDNPDEGIVSWYWEVNVDSVQPS